MAVVCALGTLGIFVESGPFKGGEAFYSFAFGLAGPWWLLTGILLIVRPLEIAAAKHPPGSS